VILVDANVVLHAYYPRAEKHQPCRRWIEEAFSGLTPIGLSWITVWAFLRIITNPRAFEQSLSMREAMEIVSAWFEVPVVILLEPGERYWELLGRLLLDSQVKGPLVTDAALAALALEHGASLCTTDLDFTRFRNLKVLDPASE
jgi:toxin-antitoxin system PIN domain toxin